MKNIHDVIRAKELELLNTLEEALQQKETELRQLQKNITEALRLVNGLLQESSSAGQAEPLLAPRPAPVAASAASIPKPIAVGEPPVKRFP